MSPATPDALFAALATAVLESPAELSVATRAALMRGELEAMPQDAEAYLSKVDGPSYKTTDEEVSALVEFLGEEAVFEATVAVAVGAAQRQIDKALVLFEEERG